MGYLKSIDEVKFMCRICLTQSDDMVSLENKLDDKCENSPIILDALENMMSFEINTDERYPTNVCSMCYGHVRLCYDLRDLFYKSQNIFDKYISSLETLAEDEDTLIHDNENQSFGDSIGLSSDVDLDNVIIKHESLSEYDSETQQEYSEQSLDTVKPLNKFGVNSENEMHLEDSERLPVSMSEVETDMENVEDDELQDENEMSPEQEMIDEIVTPKVDMENIETTDSEKPSKVVKLKIGGSQKNCSTVKWLEGNKFIIEKNLPAHKCCFCHKRYLSKAKLTEHKLVCKKFVLIKCNSCNSTFPSYSSRSYHIRMRHGTNGPPRFRCDICNLEFKTSHAKGYHKLTRHTKNPPKYTCDVCGKEFIIKNSLAQHMESHSKDVTRIVCPICGKGFHYRGGLFYHMKVHKNERNYLCSFCQKRFLNMASLKRHTRVHTGERPYTCNQCPKTFCSVGELKTHKRRHDGIKPFPCKYCEKCFLTPYNLKLHISAHSGSEPCSLCEKSYLNDEALKYHMDIKHNIREEKPVIIQI